MCARVRACAWVGEVARAYIKVRKRRRRPSSALSLHNSGTMPAGTTLSPSLPEIAPYFFLSSFLFAFFCLHFLVLRGRINECVSKPPCKVRSFVNFKVALEKQPYFVSLSSFKEKDNASNEMRYVTSSTNVSLQKTLQKLPKIIIFIRKHTFS